MNTINLLRLNPSNLTKYQSLIIDSVKSFCQQKIKIKRS